MAACAGWLGFYRPRFLMARFPLSHHPDRRNSFFRAGHALGRGLLLLSALLLLPAALALDPVPDANGRIITCKPGPWGEMEYSRIVIEPPDEFMAADYTAVPTRWNFAGFDASRLEQLWQQASLGDAQLKALRDPAIQFATQNGITVTPGDALVQGLSPASRAIIYNQLAELPGNPLHNEPFRFRAEMLDEWFEDSGVSEPVVARIKELLYRRGNSLLFSDPKLVLPLLPTAADRVLLVKTLARKSTLLVKVRIRPDSDIETIAGYWSTGRRRKDVKPLLHSLSRHRGGTTIDVVHLLPRFARGLLYTYPSPDVPRELSPDCHWTSMNFFNDPPDQRFDDIDYLKEVLIKAYTPVQGRPAMGDLLVMTKPNGEVIHSCIYLADDIVFTKNGRAPSIPWTLTTLPDLQAVYPAHPALEVRVFRKKE